MSKSPLAPVTRGLRSAAALLVLAALVFATTPASAQWKWRDASGQITVSDRPPPKDVPERDILSRPVLNLRPAPVTAAASAPVIGASAPKTRLEQDVEAKKRAADQEASAKTKADEERAAQARAENCRKARAHLAALETGQRMARMNDKGEREVLDDKARADEMRSAREVIASDCR